MVVPVVLMIMIVAITILHIWIIIKIITVLLSDSGNFEDDITPHLTIGDGFSLKRFNRRVIEKDMDNLPVDNRSD